MSSDKGPLEVSRSRNLGRENSLTAAALVSASDQMSNVKQAMGFSQVLLYCLNALEFEFTPRARKAAHVFNSMFARLICKVKSRRRYRGRGLNRSQQSEIQVTESITQLSNCEYTKKFVIQLFQQARSSIQNHKAAKILHKLRSPGSRTTTNSNMTIFIDSSRDVEFALASALTEYRSNDQHMIFRELHHFPVPSKSPHHKLSPTAGNFPHPQDIKVT